MTLIHSAGELNHLPALFTCHLNDEANGPLAIQLQRACHQPRPWLISVSLDAHAHPDSGDSRACVVRIDKSAVSSLRGRSRVPGVVSQRTISPERARLLPAVL